MTSFSEALSAFGDALFRLVAEQYIPDKTMAAKVVDATWPVLSGLIERGFVLQPWDDSRDEAFRGDLARLISLDVAIDKVRIGEHLACLHARRQAEHAATEAAVPDPPVIEASEYIKRAIAPVFEGRREMLAHLFSIYSRLPRPELPKEDPCFQLWDEALMERYFYFQGAAFFAAAAGKEELLQAILAFLPWLACCVPMSVSSGDPSTLAILIA